MMEDAETQEPRGRSGKLVDSSLSLSFCLGSSSLVPRNLQRGVVGGGGFLESQLHNHTAASRGEGQGEARQPSLSEQQPPALYSHSASRKPRGAHSEMESRYRSGDANQHFPSFFLV